MKIPRRVQKWALSDQGQGHRTTSAIALLQLPQ